MARGVKTEEYRIRNKRLPVRVLLTILVVFVAIALILFAMSPFLVDSYQAESGAMSPSIEISDTVGVNHLAYLLLPPSRGDIILFHTSRAADVSGNEALSMRRIIGLPGETVQIMNGTVYINGYPLEEEYRSGEMSYSGTAASALTLNSDEYFVMADNRSNNFDSRDSTVGPVPGSEIIGKVWLKLKPFDQFGLIG